jgi:succinate dehydrogenase/fumarate reductase flavoprotein subunit
LVKTDVLVVGGGIAGCFAAITARKQGVDVLIVDKAYAGKSGAGISAGGWYMVFNSEWGYDFNTTMNEVAKIGEYLNNRVWTEIVLKESWSTYMDLVSWGVEFPVEPEKRRDYLREQIIRTKSRAERQPHIEPYSLIPLRHRKTAPTVRAQAEKVGAKILDRVMVTDLLKQDDKVVGAAGFSLDNGEFYIFTAKATVLAAGNSGLKPPGMQISMQTGDADAMAYRAGAELSGKEFLDHHITFANYPSWRTEIYPAYFYFTDAEGNPIPAKGFDLSMVSAVHSGRGPILYDLDAATREDLDAIREYIRKRANPIELERIGLDPTRGGKYIVAGGAWAGGTVHGTGGLWPVDTKCSSSLEGLFAAGDCCSTYYFGAVCRGASWGLTGAAVTGRRAGAGAAEYALKADTPELSREEIEGAKNTAFSAVSRKSGFNPRWVTQLLQNIMMPYFIIYIKHEKRLQAALTLVEFLRDNLASKIYARDPHELRLAHETKNMILNAEIILRSSLFRKESRGTHYREDYPERKDPDWLAWTKIKDEEGEMKVWKQQLPKEWQQT